MKPLYPKFFYALGNLLLLVCCSCFLLIPAFINGYPIVNSDTGTYLFSGFLFEIPADRPITYGLLIRLFSYNGATLWTVIGAQAFIVVVLITMIVRHYFEGKKHYVVSLIIIAVLATTTSLSWIVCELIADVYTTIGLLAILCLFICKTGKITQTLLFVLLFVAMCTHMSHTIIFISLASLVLIFNKRLFKKAEHNEVIKKISIIICICLASIIVISPTASKSQHAFLMASFLQKGILKKYLDDQCPTAHYKICKYKDDMLDDPNWFLWNSGSPFIQEGDWNGTKAEYTAINKKILTHIPYNTSFVEQSIPYTLQQLISYKIGDGNSTFDNNSNIAIAINTYVSHKEYMQFLGSKQNTESYVNGNLNLANTIILIVVSISVISIMLYFILGNLQLSYSAKQLLFICFTGILINCWDCATFAQVNGRYGCRVMWLLPLCMIIMLYQKKTSSSLHHE